jgi:hypothetical protein
VRQIKRLKKRMREDGEAALAHAKRGRPSHRRLPQAVRERILWGPHVQADSSENLRGASGGVR